MSLYKKLPAEGMKIIITLFILFLSFPNTVFSLEGSSDNPSDLVKYPFRPSDGLLISAFPDTSSFLNRVFPIDDRGFVEFPIIGKVNISKMTKEELIVFLKENFKSYLRYPNLYVKPVVRVSMLGGFARPGLYYVDINSSLWEIVHLAGGPVLEDGIYEMKWERDHDKNVGDLTPLFEQGVSLGKMGFKSGDQIWTPSPDARTFWDVVRDVMPLLTFTASIWMLYITYQTNVRYLTQ